MAGNASTPDEPQPTIVWDDTSMATTYANAADVTASREAINILFGVEQARQAGRNEVTVQLLKHLALSPWVAKRLAVELNNAINGDEARRNAPQPPGAASVDPRKPTAADDREPAGHAAQLEKILTLFQAMGALDAPIDFEHSFKLTHGQLLENRFLLGVDRRDAGGGLDARIAAVCDRIGMPKNLLVAFSKDLADANHVYFGVEKDGQTLVFKAYLERRDTIESEIAGADVSGRSFALFTGFKWDTAAPDRQAVTRYDWYPSLAVAGMLERLRANLDPQRHGELLGIVEGIVERAAVSIANGDIQYLEVSEDGNPRRSFDINVYKSGLRLADVFPQVLGALRHFGISNDRFEPLYQRIKSERLGHLAGGVDRQGRDFMTVYYGVHPVHSSQLGSARITGAGRE